MKYLNAIILLFIYGCATTENNSYEEIIAQRLKNVVDYKRSERERLKEKEKNEEYIRYEVPRRQSFIEFEMSKENELKGKK